MLGMFWSYEANEVVLSDGRERRTGESLRFLEYFGHQAVAPELGDLNIGLFDETATMWLLLDTLADNLSVDGCNPGRLRSAWQFTAGLPVLRRLAAIVV